MINSRRKGHQFERDVCSKLRSIFPLIERALSGSASDKAGVDLVGTNDWRFQLKRGRNYAPANKIEEIKIDGNHALVSKADHKEILVTIPFDLFVQMLEIYEKISDKGFKSQD